MLMKSALTDFMSISKTFPYLHCLDKTWKSFSCGFKNTRTRLPWGSMLIKVLIRLLCILALNLNQSTLYINSFLISICMFCHLHMNVFLGLIQNICRQSTKFRLIPTVIFNIASTFIYGCQKIVNTLMLNLM